MKRLHISINVTDLDKSIVFYSKLFGLPPALQKEVYAKWLVGEPCVNFVIERATTSGLTHAGIETDSAEELTQLYDRFKAVGPYEHEGMTNCCYHESEKSWTADPDGLAWEAFQSFSQTPARGDGKSPQLQSDKAGVDAQTDAKCCS